MLYTSSLGGTMQYLNVVGSPDAVSSAVRGEGDGQGMMELMQYDSTIFQAKLKDICFMEQM